MVEAANRVESKVSNIVQFWVLVGIWSFAFLMNLVNYWAGIGSSSTFIGSISSMFSSFLPLFLMAFASIWLALRKKTLAATVIPLLLSFGSYLSIFISGLFTIRFNGVTPIWPYWTNYSWYNILFHFIGAAISLYLLAMILLNILTKKYEFKFEKSFHYLVALIVLAYYFVFQSATSLVVPLIVISLALLSDSKIAGTAIMLSYFVTAPTNFLNIISSETFGAGYNNHLYFYLNQLIRISLCIGLIVIFIMTMINSDEYKKLNLFKAIPADEAKQEEPKQAPKEEAKKEEPTPNPKEEPKEELEVVEPEVEEEIIEDEPTNTVENNIEYEKMTVEELRNIASERGLTGYSKFTKSELIDLLKK